MTRVQKKDFERTTHRVGKAKTKRNETKVDSVSSRKVVMPNQNIECSGDTVGDALIGLRHYNEKKRLDAIHSLTRNGFRNIQISYLGDIILGVGFCLCDDDALVRSKCASFLLQVISATDKASLAPFIPKITIQIRAGLGHVNASVRLDAINFLHRLVVADALFPEEEAKALIITLNELDGTFITVSDPKTSSMGSRILLWDCIELLLFHLVTLQDSIRGGETFSSEWTVPNILSRVFSPHDKLGPSLAKLVSTLCRMGEDDRVDRLKSLCLHLVISLPNMRNSDNLHELAMAKKPVKSKNRSVFSRLSALMSDQDDPFSD